MLLSNTTSQKLVCVALNTCSETTSDVLIITIVNYVPVRNYSEQLLAVEKCMRSSAWCRLLLQSVLNHVGVRLMFLPQSHVLTVHFLLA